MYREDELTEGHIEVRREEGPGVVEARLRAARQMIQRPEHWCRGAMHSAPARFNRVDQWCSLGAIHEATRARGSMLDTILVRIDATDYLAAAISGWTPEFLRDRPALRDQIVWFYNDDARHSHDDVLAMFDRAIALAHERGV